MTQNEINKYKSMVKEKKEIKCLNFNELKSYTIENQWCVYRIWVKDRFFIGTCAQLVRKISADLRFLRSENPNYLEKVKNYMQKIDNYSFTFKIYAYCEDEVTANQLRSFLIQKYQKTKLLLN